MRVALAALAVVWTLLLGLIAFQLQAINTNLEWLSAPNRALAAAKATASAPARVETREQRIERRVHELREASDESAEVMRRVLEANHADKSPTVKPSR